MGARLGHPMSVETKAKIGAANKGRKPWSYGKIKYLSTGKNARSIEYKTWCNMKNRCLTDPSYIIRKTVVCNRWANPINGFTNFYADMGDKPEGLTLDRIDNIKGYFPDNCRWATPHTQMVNQKLRKTNKTGYRGVSFDKRSGKYVATIWLDFSMRSLGLHSDVEQAALAYDAAAVQLHGTDAYLNILELS